MLLPSTHFHTFTSSSSSFYLFPSHFPKSKTLAPSKFLIRSSTSKPGPETLPESVIQRIADKLHSLGITDQSPVHSSSTTSTSTAAGEIFVPLPHQLPKQRIGHTIDSSWSTPENRVQLPRQSENELERKRRGEENEEKKRRVPTLAELSLTDAEILRLRKLGFELKTKLKVGKGGVTEGIVNGIHERWRRSEVVRIVCEDLCRINMKRTHDTLERKTGGLVVWRSGSKIVLYRGIDYKYPYFLSDKDLRDDQIGDALQHVDGNDKNCDERESHSSETNSLTRDGRSSKFKTAKPTLIQGVGTPNKVRFQLPGEAELGENADSLLEGLGPRFTDWWGYDPVPVDADLLPAVIPGFRQPFRLLPYGVNSRLTDDEMTTLKRLGRPLPCHFALGRDRKLHGLAAAIIKLWERCEIVKIAVKRGVQNTRSQIMAEEIKHLTGGTLLSRDEEVIVLYRGKDFLPSAVSSAIQQRRNILMNKVKAENYSSVTVSSHSEGNDLAFQKDTAIIEKKMLMKAKAAIKRTSAKLSEALENKEKAEELLAQLETAESPNEQENDKEGITEEERYMLRRIGLKMKPFLLLGRRGVFDGTVENMHLHWKYRELVKIMCNQGSLEAAHLAARTLEAESGGILVAVERVSKGYAIIVYRGKNYSRPASLRPRTLLNKKQALKRSIEAQRYQSLKLNVLKLDKNINELKLQMVKDEANSKQIAEALTSDLAIDKHGSPKEISVVNQQAIQEHRVEPIDSSVAHEVEPIDSSVAHEVEPTDSSVAHQVEPIDSSVAHQVEPTDSSGAHQVEPIDSSGAHQVEPIDSSGVHQVKPEPWAALIHKERQLDKVSDSVVDTGYFLSSKEAVDSLTPSSKSFFEPSAQVINGSSNESPSKSMHLSNRERLLLRKLALKMKNRPVLAIGKSNVVTGLAKAIKDHFRKLPFVIVNVKGRAKGTSVQELVFKLEQATGAVFVSQEPSKVILYRGWGAEAKPGTELKDRKVSNELLGVKPSVSPELLEAIRAECGLQ